ncbi:P-type conjugative transfer protein TrbL (plasmid) [Rhizorhabdus wittichii DC-6]|nr:P-type conjugative transfer protein TrbL [Rhizorhabdus wittichii DC-6]
MPSPANTDILTKFLDAYSSAIDSGFGLINSDVMGIMSIVATIALALAAIFWALDENGRITSELFRKALLFGFFLWLVNDWKGLSWTVVKGFTALGLKAGGSGMGVDAFLDKPGNIVKFGFDHVIAMGNVIKSMTGPVAFFDNFAAIIIIAFAAIGTIAAFFVIAVQLVVTLIEFRLVTLAAFVLIPFGVLKQTSFLTERALGYVVSSGLKLMTIALIVTIGGKTFNNITLVAPGNPDLATTQALSILLAAILLMMLSLVVPAIANALVAGGPQLGGGAALAGAAGVAAAAGGAYLAGRGAIGAGRAAMGAPAAMAAKAQAAAGAIREGAKSGIPPLGGFGSGTMGPAPGPSSGGGGGGGGGGGTPSPSGGGGMPSAPSGGGAGLDAAPTARMQDTAQKIASEKGVEPPDMTDGRAVRDFLNKNSNADLGAYRPNAASPPSSAAQPSSTTGSAANASSADTASAAAPSSDGGAGTAEASAASSQTDSVPSSSGADTGPASDAGEASAAAKTDSGKAAPTPAPSTAPPPDVTVARAEARSKAHRASRTTRAAQAAAAATSSQGGAGMTADIEHSED